jgi:hypothetical protein
VFYTTSMAHGTTLQQARAILGRDVVGLDELHAALGAVEGIDTDRAAAVPFSIVDLEQAKENDEMLVLRAARIGSEALTLQWLIRRFPDAFDQGPLRKVGYQLRDEWGIELEPLAATATCRPQWALARKDILAETRNLSYDEHVAHIDQYGVRRSAPGRSRRRTAIETVFDTIVYHRVRGERLLASSWDWSSSRTTDGGFLNIGRFNEAGLQIFSYSRAVRHGQLGVCPTLDPEE